MGIARHHVKKLGTRDYVPDTQIDRLTSAAKSMRVGAEKIRDLAVAIREDKSISGSQARLTFSNSAQTALTAAQNRMHEAMKATLAEMARLDKEIAPPPPADKYVAQAIWQTLREAKTPDARQAIVESDSAVMSALAYAPPSVSGMTATERDHLVQTWQREKFPEESARRLRLSKALDDARNVTVSGERYFAEVVRKMTSPVIESAARTKSAQEAVAAAVAE